MGDGHWQLEGSAAELYQRYLVPLITSKWAEDLVHRAELREGEDHRGRGPLGGKESSARVRHGSRSERWDAGCCP